MSLEQEQREKIGTALSHVMRLLGAFEFVINMKGSADLSTESFKNIEDIIPDGIEVEIEKGVKEISGRKEQFYIKHERLAPGLPLKGFFARYIYPSTLLFKSKNYQEPLTILSEWANGLEEKLAFQEAHPHVNIISDNSGTALRALSDIQYRLVIDGGKNSLRKLAADNPEDNDYAEKKCVKTMYIKNHEQDIEREVAKMKQSLSEYLRTNKKEIKKAAIEESVKCYAGEYREELDRSAADKNLSVKKYMIHHYDDIKKAAASKLVKPYIEAHNKDIDEAAAKAGKSVPKYLCDKNEEVNRRKDVLQLLVAEIASNIRTIKEVIKEGTRGDDIRPAVGLS